MRIDRIRLNEQASEANYEIIVATNAERAAAAEPDELDAVVAGLDKNCPRSVTSPGMSARWNSRPLLADQGRV
jgi:hypothetical protein